MPFPIGGRIEADGLQIFVGQDEVQISRKWFYVSARQNLDDFLVFQPLDPSAGTLAPIDDDTVLEVFISVDFAQVVEYAERVNKFETPLT